MLLPELEPHIPGADRFSRLPDIPRRTIRSTKVDADVGLEVPFQPTKIPPCGDFIPHCGEETLKVWPAKVGPGFEFGERIDGVADGVEGDVEGGVDVEFLGEVGVDPQERLFRLLTVCVLGRLRLEG